VCPGVRPPLVLSKTSPVHLFWHCARPAVAPIRRSGHRDPDWTGEPEAYSHELVYSASGPGTTRSQPTYYSSHRHPERPRQPAGSNTAASRRRPTGPTTGTGSASRFLYCGLSDPRPEPARAALLHLLESGLPGPARTLAGWSMRGADVVVVPNRRDSTSLLRRRHIGERRRSDRRSRYFQTTMS